MWKVDNAIIMAAGTSSRFAPLSYEKPKGLITVKGEILVERQIQQLRQAGIKEIILVVGYQHEKFEYLKEKYNVVIIENPWYNTRNNHASIHVVKNYLRNSYICSSDNYFVINPFENMVDESYYSVVYAKGKTDEWCVTTDSNGYINNVEIGGENAWYMLGHAFWSEEFSRNFIDILEAEYELPQTKDCLWEKIYMHHLDILKLKSRRYSQDDIFEFDTLDELRVFDSSYQSNSHSMILKDLAKRHQCKENDIVNIHVVKKMNNEACGFLYDVNNETYQYDYSSKTFRSES